MKNLKLLIKVSALNRAIKKRDVLDRKINTLISELSNETDLSVLEYILAAKNDDTVLSIEEAMESSDLAEPETTSPIEPIIGDVEIEQTKSLQPNEHNNDLSEQASACTDDTLNTDEDHSLDESDLVMCSAEGVYESENSSNEDFSEDETATDTVSEQSELEPVEEKQQSVISNQTEDTSDNQNINDVEVSEQANAEMDELVSEITSSDTEQPTKDVLLESLIKVKSKFHREKTNQFEIIVSLVGEENPELVTFHVDFETFDMLELDKMYFFTAYTDGSHTYNIQKEQAHG